MSRRSFEAINYMLRPNKNVERKLIATTLLRLQGHFPIRDYRYVGFGSMWFTDFILMHKLVGISSLITIEKQTSRKKRVEFNKPFGCIDIKMGIASDKLEESIGSSRSIVWLDYDGPLAAALEGDVETAVTELPSGSLILLSANGNVEQLSGHRKEEVEIPPIEYLSQITDSNEILQKQHMLTRVDFPALVADILHEKLKAAVLSLKPGCEYRPIWTFQYADDATMVTVGGMIADEADSGRLNDCSLQDLPFLSASQPFEISLPILTEKEKRALDQLLPSANAIDPKNLAFELRPTELDAYRRFYLEYPVFNEMAA